MSHKSINIIKDGTVTVDSIYQLDGVYGVDVLLRECKVNNCTIHFLNENLIVTPEDQEVTEVRAKLHVYKMILNHPTAARHYINYVMKEHNENLK